MAADRERSPASSEEMLKRAWEEIGRSDPEERTRRPASSVSGALAASARQSSSAATGQSALAAEEIARLLHEEEQVRKRSRRPVETPPPPRDLPPPRPRRTAPIEVPRSQMPPPRLPSPELPPEQPVPAPGRPARRPGWLIFAAVFALLSIVGRFVDDVATEVEDVPVTLPATTEPLSLAEATVVAESMVEPGVCIVWLPPGDNATVAMVPCAMEHQYEVFAIVDAAGPALEYPGPEDAYGLGFDACLAEFPGWVGEAYVESPWHIHVIPPTESEWVEEDDRTTTCLLYQPGGDGPVYLEGTARGSGRPSA